MSAGVSGARLKLIRSRELAYRDFVLIGMARPRPVHQRVGLVLFVFSKNLQRPRVQFRIFAARVKRGHPADRQHPVFVANVRQKIAQSLKERHVVRNGVAVGQNPLGVFEIEVDQAGHVIPAAQIQSHDVVAKIPGKLFHLKSERM